MPWTQSGPNLGFGSGKPAHLPMPEWMSSFTVESEDKDAQSTLNFYRKALALRRELQGAPRSWNGWWMGMDKETLHFSRPGGWEVVMSFEGKGVKVPKGEVAISSGKLEGGEVPKDTTVWVTAT